MYIKKVALSLACSKYMYVNSHRSEVGYMLEVEFDKEWCGTIIVALLFLFSSIYWMLFHMYCLNRKIVLSCYFTSEHFLQADREKTKERCTFLVGHVPTAYKITSIDKWDSQESVVTIGLTSFYGNRLSLSNPMISNQQHKKMSHGINIWIGW